MHTVEIDSKETFLNDYQNLFEGIGNIKIQPVDFKLKNDYKPIIANIAKYC